MENYEKWLISILCTVLLGDYAYLIITGQWELLWESLAMNALFSVIGWIVGILTSRN